MSLGKKLYINLLVFFLIAFPKGGFKIADVPITWGYILLIITFFLIFIKIILVCNFSISVNRLIVFILALPFQIYILVVFMINGIQNTGFYVALLANFIFLPFLFIILMAYYYDRIDLKYTFKAIKTAILFVAVYGIALFVYKFVTKKFIEIPYLTINASDKGLLETKFINRGTLFKLISTYNNGNIYGISILMLMPLYNKLEKNVIKKLLVHASLVLTLSRTVWIGIILLQIFNIYSKKINIKSLLLLFGSFILLSICIFYVLEYMKVDVAFLFDKKLGGRASQLVTLKNIEFITSKKFHLIAEIVYVSILDGFGVLGLIFFLLLMLSPILLYLTRLIRYNKSPVKKRLFQGLVIYLILSFSDGATLYIPVMAFYWLVTGLLLSKNVYFKNEIATISTRKFNNSKLPKIIELPLPYSKRINTFK